MTFRNGVSCIAVTGGPCGGKSTFLARAVCLLLERGIHAVVLSETATEFFLANLTPGILGRMEFQIELMKYSRLREDYYRDIIQGLARKHERDVVLLCDRGLLDAAAYVSPDEFKGVLLAVGVTRQSLLRRYDLVVHLMTAALGAEDFYTCANNAARSEDLPEARLLDARTQNAWLGHPNHFVIDNSTGFDGKVGRALQTLARKIGVPESLEIERKFLLRDFSPDMIPQESVKIAIEQAYLPIADGVERRVRRWECFGEATYFYTEKTHTGRFGTRVNRETLISRSEYERLRGLTPYVLRKCRYAFVFAGHHMDMDVYEDRKNNPEQGGGNLAVIEVELGHIDEHCVFPPALRLEDVTGNHRFSNRVLSGCPGEMNFQNSSALDPTRY